MTTTVHQLLCGLCLCAAPLPAVEAERPWPGFGERRAVFADAGDASPAWVGDALRPVPGREGGARGWRGPGRRSAAIAIPIAAMRGSRVAINACVQAKGVNGVGIMLEVTGPAGVRQPGRRAYGGYPHQEEVADGARTLRYRVLIPPHNRDDARTYAWQTVETAVLIPSDATAARLELDADLPPGGEVAFDDLAVTVIERAPAPPPAPPAAPPSSSELRGFMLSRHVTPADIAVAADDFGANLLRFQIGPWSINREPVLLRDDFESLLAEDLAVLDAILPAAAQRGVRVLIDLHTLGNGFWASPAAQERFIALWRRLARTYRGRPGVWGYELANEPFDFDLWGHAADDPRFAWHGWEPGRLTWNECAELAARAVRAEDPDGVVVVEPGRGGNVEYFATFTPLTVPGVVYSFHMYDPLVYTHQGVNSPPGPWSYPGAIDGAHWDRAALERSMAPARRFQEQWGAPMYVGEFSAVRWAPGAATYLSDLIAIFEEWGWDASYHAFRESPVWDLEIPARFPRDRKLGLQQRAEVRTDPHTDRAEIIRAWFARNRSAGPSAP